MLKTLAGWLILSASLAGCADVGTVTNRIDPNTETPQYLMLTCQDASASACRLGIGKAVDPKADNMNTGNGTRSKTPQN